MAAPRKTAASSKPRPIRSAATPAQNVHFSLETFEREEVYDLFAADLDGRRVEMIDPQELVWEELAQVDAPAEFLELCLTEDDRKYVYGLQLKAWQINGLMHSYMRHYGLGDRGKGDA